MPLSSFDQVADASSPIDPGVTLSKRHEDRDYSLPAKSGGNVPRNESFPIHSYMLIRQTCVHQNHARLLNNQNCWLKSRLNYLGLSNILLISSSLNIG